MRNPGARTLGAFVAALLLSGYIGGYLANLDRGYIVYVDSDRSSIWAEQSCTPKFVVAQIPSEILFWPAYEIHRRIEPGRFSLNSSDPLNWPEFRDKWWNNP